MAQKPVNNNKGQALIEATVMMVFAGAFLFILLRCLLVVIFSVALDAMAEDYFICELEQKQNCVFLLEARLKNNQLKNISVKANPTGDKIVLTVSATHMTSMTLTREFDYAKFRQQL